jgi:hypothetical protein
MATARAQNDTLQLEVEAPAPGAPRVLTGELTFPSSSHAESATVSLVLFANARSAALGDDPDRIDAQTSVAGCTTTVKRSEAAPRFELPLPPAAAPYQGEAFTIHVGVVAAPDQGTTLRVFVDVPAATEGLSSVLRGLPKEQRLARPAPLVTAVVMALAGAGLVALAWVRDLLLPGQIGFAVLGVGVLLAFIFRRGALGWLRVGNPTTRLEARDGALFAAVRGSDRLSGGRARIVATEYERYDGHAKELREITSRDVPLEKREDGSWAARVPLPAAGEAPPSLALTGPKRLEAIRWVAKIEMESARGSVAHVSIPVHVGLQKDG